MPAVPPVPPKQRLVVAITGASGSVYGVRLLERLRETPGWETHLVMSPAGALTASHELPLKRAEIEALADRVHGWREVGASIASGSFRGAGMVVAPCSMTTLASIAHGFGDNLVGRAADVALKERRRLVLLVREAPLNLAHLRNMVAATEMGAIVFPPVPAFYAKPASIDEMVDHTVGRVLDLFGIELPDSRRWDGLRRPPEEG